MHIQGKENKDLKNFSILNKKIIITGSNTIIKDIIEKIFVNLKIKHLSPHVKRSLPYSDELNKRI